jgi:hypothetical protein
MEYLFSNVWIFRACLGARGVKGIGGAKILLLFNFEQQGDFRLSNPLHFPCYQTCPQRNKL